MKIVLTSNYQIGNETGASAVTDLLAKKLSQKHKVVYICLGKKLKKISKNKNLTLLTLPYYYFRGIYFPIITPQAIFLINKELDKFNPDVIHTQNHILISKITQAWGNLNRVPVITTFHHIPTEGLKHLLPELGKSFIANLVQNFYTQTTLKNYLHKCFAIISLNQKQYKEIKKVDKNIKNVIIYNGLEIYNLLKIKRKKPVNKFRFVFLGSYTDRKNQMFLVNTFKFLSNNFKLYLYGNFESGQEYLRNIKEVIKSEKINNVFINDFVKRDKIVEIYKTTNFYISASKKEVQSLSIIEALSSGLPVIGLENETINDLISDKNGLKVSKNVAAKSYAKKINDFTYNCDYLKLSKNAKGGSFKFDIRKTILKVEKLYESARNSKS